MDYSNAKAKVRDRAAGQAGRITWAQLRECGLTPTMIRTWVRHGQLIRTHRRRQRVYALGYLRTDRVALLWDAVLYAGPDAYLTGASGAHHLGLINYPPTQVMVGTPRRCNALDGITVHGQRPLAWVAAEDGIPVAPTPELMLALAAEGRYNVVRRALSVLEFRRELDIKALLAMCTPGRRGGALLRRAVTHRLPQLAYCKSELEIDFLLFLEAHHLPLPRVNWMVHGIEADMYWRDLKLVVELDGKGNHGTAYHGRRDDSTMAKLRAHGLTVLRFDDFDVHEGQDGLLTALAREGLRA